MLHKETIIPSAVWKFVKTIVKNPVKSGILALIIAGFLNKQKENYNYLESLREMAEEFKIGDDVEIINSDIPEKNGRKGKIVYIDYNRKAPYGVKIKNIVHGFRKKSIKVI